MKNIFTHVTVRTLKKNKTRTTVTIIGIILATAMLTAVTTFISSLQDYMVKSAIAEEGNWYGSLLQVPEEGLRRLSENEEVTAISSYQELGYAWLQDEKEDNILERHKAYLFVAGITEEFKEMVPVTLYQGRLPENSSEIAVPRHLLTEGKADIEIGDTLTLELGHRNSDGETLGAYNPLTYKEEDGSLTLAETLIPRGTRTYTVVGIIERPIFEDYSSAAYTCVTAAEDSIPDGCTYTCYFRIQHPSDIYEFIEKNGEGKGGTYNSTLLRFLGTSSNRPFMQMLYGLAAILILLIMTGGISLVYNSFAISVSDRTKQFGLLASVGATPRQLKGMVLREALLVSAAGIPLGILSGIAGIGITLHFTGKSFYYLYSGNITMSLHVSVWAVLLAAGTAFLTVLISAWIPSRRAAGVSPIEAIRQSKDIAIPKQVVRKGRLSFRLFGLPGLIAGKHFSRNKKQYRATIFSLFISIVLFISASSFSAYLKSSIDTVQETPDYDVAVYIQKDEGPADEPDKLAAAVRELKGVDASMLIKNTYAEVLLDPALVTADYLSFMERGAENNGLDIYEEGGSLLLDNNILVLEDEAYRDYLKEQGITGSEYLDFTQGTVVALNQIRGYVVEEQRYRNYNIIREPGLDFNLKLTDYAAWWADAGSEELSKEIYQKTIQVNVGAFVEKAPLNLYAGWGGGFCIIMPESMLESLIGPTDGYFRTQTVYLKSEAHQAVTERIDEMELSGEWSVYFFANDVTENYQTQRNMLFTVDVFTYGFIILISLIAVANVFNTISTGFLLRKREFAVLSSVGMAPKDLHKMLNYECLLYGCKSLLFGLPVSVLITWRIYRTIASSMDIGFYIPVSSIIIAVFSVFAVVFATMVYARNRMKRENIIDSIRSESL